jgi:hypothetical protein
MTTLLAIRSILKDQRSLYNFKLYFDKYFHVLIILSGILLRLPLLFASMNYDTDAWRQADTASIAYHFYLNGYKLLYPQIFWGGNGPGYVETEFQLYPFIVSLLYSLMGEKLWLGKLISLLFSVFAWLSFYRLAEQVFKENQIARWALFFLVFSPLYIRYSVEFMPEGTVMFFYICGLSFFVDWLSTLKKSHLLISAVSIALAVLVKPTSIHVGLIFALLAFEKMGIGVLKRLEIWVSTIIALTPSVAWYWHARNLYMIYGNTFGLLSGGDNKFGNWEIWLSPHFYVSLLRLDVKWVLGYGLVLVFAAGLLVASRKKEYRLIVFGLIVIGVYYAIVARYSSQEWGIQYHIYALPFFALATGVGVKWAINNRMQIVMRSLLGISVGVFIFSALVLFYRMLVSDNDNLMQCAQYVNRLVPAGDRVIISTLNVAVDNGVQNNYQEPQIFFYSKRYGWSLPADLHNVEKLIEMQKAGAAYFVLSSQELLNANPSLAVYLESHSLQIGPGLDSGCAIYRFN